MKRLAILAAALVVIGGCSKPSEQKTAAAAPAPKPIPYNTEISTKALMDHAIDPAADLVWAASGYVVDMQGTHDLSPTTPEGWKKVQDNAAIVAELSNALMLPGRSPEEPQWNGYATRLHETAMESLHAAERHDKAGLLHAGSDMFLACTACHKYYVLGEKD